MGESGYPAGVKLGVDVGLARVGLASCDREGLLATPISTLQRDAKKNSDVAVIVREAVQRKAVEIFVGLPRTLRGTESESALMARNYAGLLAQRLQQAGAETQVRLIDERLSTVSAHRSLHEAGISSRKRRKLVDQVAAVGILQHAIDSQRSLQSEVGVLVRALPKAAVKETPQHPGHQVCETRRPSGQEGDGQ